MYSSMLDHFVFFLSSIRAQLALEGLFPVHCSDMCVPVIMSIIHPVTMSTAVWMFMWMRSLHVYRQLALSSSHKFANTTKRFQFAMCNMHYGRLDKCFFESLFNRVLMNRQVHWSLTVLLMSRSPPSLWCLGLKSFYVWRVHTNIVENCTICQQHNYIVLIIRTTHT